MKITVIGNNLTLLQHLCKSDLVQPTKDFVKYTCREGESSRYIKFVGNASSFHSVTNFVEPQKIDSLEYRTCVSVMNDVTILVAETSNVEIFTGVFNESKKLRLSGIYNEVLVVSKYLMYTNCKVFYEDQLQDLLKYLEEYNLAKKQEICFYKFLRKSPTPYTIALVRRAMMFVRADPQSVCADLLRTDFCRHGAWGLPRTKLFEEFVPDHLCITAAIKVLRKVPIILTPAWKPKLSKIFDMLPHSLFPANPAVAEWFVFSTQAWLILESLHKTKFAPSCPNTEELDIDVKKLTLHCYQLCANENTITSIVNVFNFFLHSLFFFTLAYSTLITSNTYVLS